MSKNLTEEIKEKLDEILDKQDQVLEEVSDSEERRPVKEVSGIGIKYEDNMPGSKEVARIIKESKDQGIERGRVEVITNKSSKPAQRIMRSIAEEFDEIEFRKGDNTGPSKLFNKNYLPG